jgi:hypothetical protein
VMTNFLKDFEDFDPKTAISTNVYGCVTGPKVNLDQCSLAPCDGVKVVTGVTVWNPKGGGQ